MNARILVLAAAMALSTSAFANESAKTENHGAAQATTAAPATEAAAQPAVVGKKEEKKTSMNEKANVKAKKAHHKG